MQVGYRLKVRSRDPNGKVEARHRKALLLGAGKVAHGRELLSGQSPEFESESQKTRTVCHIMATGRGRGTVPHLALSHLRISCDLGNHGVASSRTQN